MSSVEAAGHLESQSQDGGQDPQERAGIPETTWIPASWRREEGVARLVGGGLKGTGQSGGQRGTGPPPPGPVALRPRVEGEQTATQPDRQLQDGLCRARGAPTRSTGAAFELLWGSLDPLRRRLGKQIELEISSGLGSANPSSRLFYSSVRTW